MVLTPLGMISLSASRTLVKSVAVFEAVKGGIVLLAGFGVLSLLGRDLRALAMSLVGWLHLDPSRRFTSVFIEAASNTTDARLWFIAGFGFVYATFRFTEAYGLWKARAWAEWLALVSGGIYLPVEVYELLRRVTWIRMTALIANLAVVILMAVVLWQNRRRHRDGVALP
ncbi:MAG: uncharacterized protein JWM88_2028 [Verrucomicrobia bacterium]|nr:uncharacterized protein [Verrucomicrobiota bacterium]